jgi:DNA primase large subunit
MKVASKFQVPMYNERPKGRSTTEELEELLNLRYKVLHEIEAKIQLQKEKQENTTSTFRYPHLENMLHKKDNKICWEKSPENDNTSFFMLAFAYCKSEQERYWLANLESVFFMARLEHYKVDLEEILKLLNIPLEKQENLPQNILDKVLFREKYFNPHSGLNTIFRVPFEYALNFIPTMNYFLFKGYVYITRAEICSLIETVFKENILKKLQVISKNIERILSDVRIKNLIINFQTRRELETLSKPFTKIETTNLNFKDIDPLSEKAFPLCMQNLNRALTFDSHLKHWGRLQYGLFLKGIGLSLEESLNFWKQKFSKKMAGDKFDKEYSYNIRHSYGKEGKRSDYIPYSCDKIQNRLAAANTGEYHGCPFKTFSEDKLRQLLHDMKLSELNVLKILEKARNKEYSVNT